MEYLVVAYPADKRVKGVWGFQVFCSDQTGEIWGELSRENMRDNLSESEKLDYTILKEYAVAIITPHNNR
jgi:hypothetical protein